MNARHWLFRLWLLITFLWIVVLGVISWPMAIKDYGWADSSQLGQYRSAELPVRCEEARGTVHLDYWVREAAEPWNRDDYETPSHACWYNEQRFRALWPEYKNMPLADLSAELYRSLEWSQQFNGDPYLHTKLAALVAFVPSLALFAVGRLFAWAFVGAIRLVKRSKSLP